MPNAIPRWKPPHQRGMTQAKEHAHYATADWRAKRRRVLLRDSFVCRSCGTVSHGKAAHVDHVVPLEDGGTDDDANLQTLCSACHGRKTRDEQHRRGFLR